MSDHEDRIRDLEAEVEHWKRVALDPSVALRPSADGVDMVMRHAIIGGIATTLGEILGDAPNYVSMVVNGAECGTLIVTVQRGSGKTPHDLATEYRKRLETMGVTDLAPLPPPLEKHQPNPGSHPHVFVDTVKQQFECRGCGQTAPCPEETAASRWGDLCRAFEDLHRGCKREAE